MGYSMIRQLLTLLLLAGIVAVSIGQTFLGQQSTPYIINVRGEPFYAKGDCTTDDTTSIQNAINAAPSNSTVLFPPGVTLSSTVTITIASPAVITQSGYTYVFNQPITFSTTASLPTGLVAGQTYYVSPINGTTYNVMAVPSGSLVNTSGTQSGTQTAQAVPCYRITSGLTLGNGSSSASSTIQNVTLQGGVGIGGNQTLDSAARNVRIMWGGASNSGTMLTTNGPISRRIVDLTFDGAFRANVGLSETHLYNSYDRYAVIGTVVTAVREIPLQTLPTGLFIGSCANYHDQTQVFVQGTTSTTGIDLGFTASSGPNFDICGETWNHISVITNSDAASTALLLRGTDNMVFVHPVLECSSGVICSVIRVTAPTSASGLPAEIHMQDAVTIGVINTPNNCTTWNPASNSSHAGLYFSGLMQGYSAAAAPTDSCAGAVIGTTAANQFFGRSNLGRLRYCVTGVNFNSATTDNAISMAPVFGGRYAIDSVRINNASASISTATLGLFTGAGGTGQTIAANQAITVTQAATDTNNNTMSLTLTNANTEAYNDATLQARVGTAQGSAATADVCIYIIPLS